MLIQTEKHAGIDVIRPVGRVDSASATAFEQAIAAAFDTGSSSLVLDFSKLEYISSAGLRGVLIAGKKARALPGGKLVLCSLSPPVAEIFTISGFISLFTVCDKLDAALAQFSA
jgi:anti-sigma B factor antagonist/stage II sporulation protein AA (anti-sigma F factor antagonist)